MPAHKPAPAADDKKDSSADTKADSVVVHDTAQLQPEAVIKYRNNQPPITPALTLRNRITSIIKFLQSPPSVYGMKGAIAVLILAIVLFSQPTFFTTWNLSGALITLLVAISPSLGQTYMSFFINVGGVIIGGVWSYISLIAWRIDDANVYNVYGLSFFVVLLAIPFVYIFQNATALRALGLLSLLSYSSSTILSYHYRFAGPNGLPFDPPDVRLYKQLAATSLALTFVLVFSVTIFPNLARRILRTRISEIITVIDSFYVDLVSFTYIVLPQHVETDDPEGLRNELVGNLDRLQRVLPSMFAQLGTLIAFSRVEPMVEGRFEAEKYAAIIKSLQVIVDRLVSAKTAVGNESFLAMKYLSPELNKARHDLKDTIKVLLYLYASAMSWKHPLPPNLPSATKARYALFKAFISAFVKDGVNDRTDIRKSKDFIRFYSWALAMRFCAAELDKLGNLFKGVFGEMHDRFVPIDTVERPSKPNRPSGLLDKESADGENIIEETIKVAQAYERLEGSQ